MSDTIIKPEVQDPELDQGQPQVAHIVRRDDEVRGYIEQVPIEALCGKKWIPSRDPEGKPICEACKKVLAGIRSAEDGNN